MKVLIAEDDRLTLQLLNALLKRWGYETVLTDNGAEAWNILLTENAPQIAILDWVMPGMEGAEICRQFRKLPQSQMIYLILLTAKGFKEDIVTGLEAGANDYITKPFDHEELRARLQVGRQMVELQSQLAARVKELQEAMAHIKTLQGMLPICSYCKKIRDDKNYWQQLESYFYKHSDIKFSHGVCPECYEKYLKKDMEEMETESEN